MGCSVLDTVAVYEVLNKIKYYGKLVPGNGRIVLLEQFLRQLI